MWERASGRVARIVAALETNPPLVRWSPDGQHLLLRRCSGTLELLDAMSGRRVRSFAGHGVGARASRLGPTIDAEFGPAGLYSIGADATVKLWDPHTGELLAQRRHPGVRGRTLAVGGGRVIVSARGGPALDLDPATLELVGELRHDHLWCEISADGGTLLGVTDGGFPVIRTPDGGLTESTGPRFASGAAFSADGRWAVAARGIQIGVPGEEQTVTLPGTEGRSFSGVVFDGRKLLAADVDAGIEEHDLVSGEMRLIDAPR